MNDRADQLACGIIGIAVAITFALVAASFSGCDAETAESSALEFPHER